MEGIWAIPAIGSTRSFFQLEAQTGTAWNVSLAEVPLCVLVDPKAVSPLTAQLQPFCFAPSFRRRCLITPSLKVAD